MARKTLRDRLVQALLARGYRELVSPSRKYRAFETPRLEVYFVGMSGALRFNRALRVSDSISMERTQLRRDLLEEVPA